MSKDGCPATGKKLVVLGLLGTTLDRGLGPDRWTRWRPTVALCQQPDLRVDRLELLFQPQFRDLAEFVRADIALASPETEVCFRQVDFRDPWDFEEVYGVLHDFARSYAFDMEREEYLVHISTGTHVLQICLFLLAQSHFLPSRLVQTAPGGGRAAAEAVELAPRRIRRHPVSGSYTIIDLDLSRYDRLAIRFALRAGEDVAFLKSGIPTRNAAFNTLMERMEQVAADTPDPILLLGPTGSGKSRLARRIYELRKARRRVSGPLVEVNCATLRGDAAMSALFGHRRGAFTGAIADRPGLLRGADKGVLFLDEIGELGPDEQAMLLRAVEEKRFLPLGADAEVGSDFQLICGTNRDPAALAARGHFREDLLARINLWTFTLPGLARRPEDVEPNVNYELERFAARCGRQVDFNREAHAAFLDFATGPEGLWKANFRDLGAAVTRMCTLARSGRIDEALVREECDRLRTAWRAGGENAPTPATRDEAPQIPLPGSDGPEALDLFDRAQLACVVRVCRNSRTLSEAGRRLFAVSRAAKKYPNDADRLRKYLLRFGLRWEDVIAAPDAE